MKKRRWAGGIVILSLILSSAAYAGGPGTTAANFLKIGVGARATAMGDAFCALADDGTSLYWNPAGLARIKKNEFLAMYNRWFQDINQGYLSVAYPSKLGVLGLAINYVDMGKMEGRDIYGQPTGEFGASDSQAMIGYAGKVSPNLMLGISGGMVSEKIEEDTKYAYLANLGLLLDLTKSYSLGLSVQNIGSKLGEDPLPLIMKAGLAANLGGVNLAIDVHKPQDSSLYYFMGMEWWIANALALRLGFKTGQDIPSSSITGGLGFKSRGIQVDYTYVSYGDLGGTHRIAMGMGF